MMGQGTLSILVKLHLILAQSLPFALLAEIALSGTFYLATPALLLVAGLIPYRCRTCSTPLWDERTMGRWLPVRPSVVDCCGVCGQPMFGKD